MTWKHIVFERMDVFQQNMSMRKVCCFREWTFFWQNMGIRGGIFSWKIGKDILLTFMAHNIALTDMTFFDKISALQQRVFHVKLKKKWHEITIFLRMNVFWQKRGMRALYFLADWLFMTKYGHESSYIFVKIGKSGHYVDFYGP